MNTFYLYNNSPAQGPQGFIKDKIPNKRYGVVSTQEYAFAMRFSTVFEANQWLIDNKIVAVIFQAIEQ